MAEANANANAFQPPSGGLRLWALRYCADKDEKYYGFHGHLVISAKGAITGFCLTSANSSEREALWDVIDGIKGLLIGDKGYLSSSRRE